jgi:hypothetical protein
VKIEAVMDQRSRKAVIAAYKERKPAYGVYAVICTATGQAWVGQSRNLEAQQQNGLWFALRLGSSPSRSLQAAWDLHGQSEFKFEELERLRDDVPAFGRPNELKRRQSIWTARLQALAL